MPKSQIVINTGPLLALIAATGDLKILDTLYEPVFVPYEVCAEVMAGGADSFGVEAFTQAEWLCKISGPLSISTLLRNSLDHGEASVIQLALNENISTVCIDEAVGRRVARLSGLSVTGTIGVLLRAQHEGHNISIPQAIERMRARGVWLSDRVVAFALEQSK